MLLKTKIVHIEAEMNGRRISIVGRLRTVDMVVGREILIFTSLMTHDLKGTVGDHFIGVHVGGCAGTTLDHIDGELVEILSIHYLAACLRYGVVLLVGQKAELMVGHCRTQLCDGQSLHKRRIVAEMEPAYLEIFQTSHGLHSIQIALRHLDGAKKIGFHTESFVTFFFHNRKVFQAIYLIVIYCISIISLHQYSESHIMIPYS